MDCEITYACMAPGGRRRRLPKPIKLLLETPHGFAVFTLHTSARLDDNAVEHLWTSFVSRYRADKIILKRDDYWRVGDKSPLVISKRLGGMLMTCCRNIDFLAVGTPQYATMIQSQLGIRCAHNEVVMELMWGLKYLFKYFVPEEKEADLVGEHSLHMSKGLNILLRRHGFHHVEPHMVTERVVDLANKLYTYDEPAEMYSKNARYLANLLTEISDIDCRGWDPLKRATAFKMIWFPRERKNLLAQSDVMFTHDEISRIQAAQPAQYECQIIENDILWMYKKALDIYKPLMEARKMLRVSLGMSEVEN